MRIASRPATIVLIGALLVVPAIVRSEEAGPVDDGVAAGPTGTGLRVPGARRLLTAAAADDDRIPPTTPKAKGGIDALLADDNLEEAPAPTTRFFGFNQFEAAYTIPHPAHLSKFIDRLELGAQGGLTPDIKWKVSGRLDYNAVYDLRSNFYPAQVREDQRFNASFRETYLDVASGDLDFRIGRQQIIWGEVVGLFIADVVSAKDTRENIVMDFDLLRIPQWAARAEYFKDDIHLEAIWIPFPTVNRTGKPGSDFFPYPPPPPAGYGYVINNERKPREDGSQENYGVRASILRGGWDVAAFGYRSVDAAPTFFREVVQSPLPAVVYTPRHEMITQYGTTVSKDFSDFLFKAEAVYTVGQSFNVTRLSQANGVVGQNFLDYILSLEYPLADEGRLNAQLFQRVFKDHDPDILPHRTESGATLYWSTKWDRRFEPQILLIHSLNRNDWLVRPRIVWNARKDWRVVVGADVFGGHPTGLFGQYDKQDRVYVEVRTSF